MTWTEFKEHVEHEMKVQGIEHDWPIWIIDVLYPDDFGVTCNEDGELMITEYID